MVSLARPKSPLSWSMHIQGWVSERPSCVIWLAWRAGQGTDRGSIAENTAMLKVLGKFGFRSSSNGTSSHASDHAAWLIRRAYCCCSGSKLAAIAAVPPRMAQMAIRSP